MCIWILVTIIYVLLQVSSILESCSSPRQIRPSPKSQTHPLFPNLLPSLHKILVYNTTHQWNFKFLSHHQLWSSTMEIQQTWASNLWELWGITSWTQNYCNNCYQSSTQLSRSMKSANHLHCLRCTPMTAHSMNCFFLWHQNISSCWILTAMKSWALCSMHQPSSFQRWLVES